MVDQPTPEPLTVSGTVEVHFDMTGDELAHMQALAGRRQQTLLSFFVSQRESMFRQQRRRLGARRWAKMQRRLRRGFPDIVGTAKEGT